MIEITPLSLEQDLLLNNAKRTVKRLPREELEYLFISVYHQNLLKDNIIKGFCNKQLGLDLAGK